LLRQQFRLREREFYGDGGCELLRRLRLRSGKGSGAGARSGSPSGREGTPAAAKSTLGERADELRQQWRFRQQGSGHGLQRLEVYSQRWLQAAAAGQRLPHGGQIVKWLGERSRSQGGRAHGTLAPSPDRGPIPADRALDEKAQHGGYLQVQVTQQQRHSARGHSKRGQQLQLRQ
jgi:hypothetical protein